MARIVRWHAAMVDATDATNTVVPPSTVEPDVVRLDVTIAASTRAKIDRVRALVQAAHPRIDLGMLVDVAMDALAEKLARAAADRDALARGHGAGPDRRGPRAPTAQDAQALTASIMDAAIRAMMAEDAPSRR